ncbi:hypothetical protein IYQ_08501 [Aeromonas salmonicida subsp. salmonicida 01-B526]|uniref:Uncharacterized protein n=1 Tax=Aeromonas salmonicida subsp. salmonicida 01-B526 TaxID=1076135 RepID=A0ABN0E1A9_AERSS|nr:hypothetical protein IYQ_08501 [Aeromonas salmonicida subsp. salmonicida 01-B526]
MGLTRTGARSFLVKCQAIHIFWQMMRRDAHNHATKSDGFCLLAILVVKTLN